MNFSRRPDSRNFTPKNFWITVSISVSNVCGSLNLLPTVYKSYAHIARHIEWTVKRTHTTVDSHPHLSLHVAFVSQKLIILNKVIVEKSSSWTGRFRFIQQTYPMHHISTSNWRIGSHCNICLPRIICDHELLKKLVTVDIVDGMELLKIYQWGLTFLIFSIHLNAFSERMGGGYVVQGVCSCTILLTNTKLTIAVLVII